MRFRGFWLGIAIGAISTSLVGQWNSSDAGRADPPKCVPAETVAEYVHSVIQADRTFYTTDIVERMQMRGIVVAAENWRETSKLPLPAQFLMESGRLVAQGRSGLRFRLISNWAINKDNMPRTAFEETGLLQIAVSPERPYKGTKTEHGIEYFEALYPDIAVSQSCVRCHNAHPKSPKKDFRVGDVMGGLLLSIPVSR